MSQGRCRLPIRSTAGLVPALLLAGCSGMAGFEGPDPLTGGPPIQRRTSPAPSLAAGLSPAPSNITPTPGAGQLPPVPTPSTATSQAALAGGLSQPLDSGRDLRIGSVTPTSLPAEQPLWHSTDPTIQAGARLSEPQPGGNQAVAPSPNPNGPGGNTPAPVTLLPAGGSAADTLDQALKQLKTGRQVTWQSLVTENGGGWRFQCYVALPDKPGKEKHYEAVGTSELDAVRKVLDQIALESK